MQMILIYERGKFVVIIGDVTPIVLSLKIRAFSVILRTGSNPAGIDRIRSHTGNSVYIP